MLQRCRCDGHHFCRARLHAHRGRHMPAHQRKSAGLVRKADSKCGTVLRMGGQQAKGERHNNKSFVKTGKLCMHRKWGIKERTKYKKTGPDYPVATGWF